MKANGRSMQPVAAKSDIAGDAAIKANRSELAAALEAGQRGALKAAEVDPAGDGFVFARIAVPEIIDVRPGRQGGASWHDAIHSGVYPVIPVCALASSVAFAIGLARDESRPNEAVVSAAFAVIGAVALALTAIDRVAQLARYFFFGPLLAWVVVLATATWARSTEDSQCSTS